MALLPTPPEQFEKAQELLRKQLLDSQPAVALRNAPAAAELHTPLTLTFRGRRYEAKAFPYKIGIELQQIQTKIDQLRRQESEDEQVLLELLANMQDAVALFKRWLTPKFWLRRLLWRHLPNPFEQATEREVAELLGFFSHCRMRSSIQVLGSGLIRRRLSWSMPSTPLPALSEPIPAG